MQPVFPRLIIVPGLTLLGLILGCDPPPPGAAPPLFNAVDPSMQCPQGQIGWDFSTGGGADDLVVQHTSQKITVSSATLGASCGGYEGNFTQDWGLSCDGIQECERELATASSPASPCNDADFSISYFCGTETSDTYTITLPAGATSRTVKLICAVPMTVIKATYAANKPDRAPTEGDITAAVARACTGKRRCSITHGYALNNNVDPWPNHAKDTEVHYICAGEVNERVATFGEFVPLDFFCDLQERRAAFDERLHFRGASPEIEHYPGTGQTQQAADEMLELIKAACENQKSCEVRLPNYDRRWARDNNEAYRQRLHVTYWCNDTQGYISRSFFIGQNGSQFYPVKKLKFSCGLPVEIQSVEVLDQFNRATPSPELTQQFKEQCNGARVCRVPAKVHPRSGLPGVHERRRYSWTCGGLSLLSDSRIIGDAEYSTDELYNDEYDLDCPVGDAHLYKGIRIKSATVSTPNDYAIGATQQCFGKSRCWIYPRDFRDLGTGPLELKYTCGTSGEVKTAAFQYGGYYDLSCERLVTPVGYGGCLASVNPNEYNHCENQIGTCRIRVSNGNFLCSEASASYRCGNDPTLHTVSGAAGDPGHSGYLRYIDLYCGAAETPEKRAACVPAECIGQARRDKNLACLPDSGKLYTLTYSLPIAHEWLPGPEGQGSSKWGGADVRTFKEDVPYQLFAYTNYVTQNRGPLPAGTAVTLWAYDEYKLKPGQTDDHNPAGQPRYGFRCIVSEGSLGSGVAMPQQYPPFLTHLTGGKGAVLPPTCFRQDGHNDPSSSWWDASRQAGAQSEVTFRERYERTASYMVASFDARGKYSTRYIAGQIARAVNPIGFYYDPANEWINTLGFYAQSADFGRAIAVSFESSQDIAIAAQDSRVNQAELFVDIQEPEVLPQINVDIMWSQRGDSPTRNPLSGQGLLADNVATTLAERNLRATVEMARVDSSLGNIWTTDNMLVFPAVPLRGGNALLQTNRLSHQLTAAARTRLFTVRSGGNQGLMNNSNDELTAFKVRVCLDMDGLVRAPGDTDVDNVKVKANVTQGATTTTYSLGFTTRCTEPRAVAVRRELFIRPTVPTTTTESPGNLATSPNQGDGAQSTAQDTGTESSCGLRCMNDSVCGAGGTCAIPAGQSIGRCQQPAGDSASQSCEGRVRNNMASGGQFSVSLVEAATTNDSSQGPQRRSGAASVSLNLFGFSIMQKSTDQSQSYSPGRWRFELPLTPNIGNIVNAVKAIKSAPAKVEAKGSKTRSKKGFERDGLSMAYKLEYMFLIGPVPIALEVGFAAGFGLGAKLVLEGDKQDASNPVNPIFPCLSTTPAQCAKAYESVTLGFIEANNACAKMGGRLAEIRTSAAKARVNSAVAGTLNDQFWTGAQLAYRYDDPTCQDLANKPARCLDGSRTRYFWLNGGRAFAEQRGRSATLIEPSRYLPYHAFGNNLGPIVSRVPERAGVLYSKSQQILTTANAPTLKAYVCEFDAAGSYVQEAQSFVLGLEFSVGFTAQACTPSSDIGFCLSAVLNLFNAGIDFDIGRSRTFIYGTNGRLRNVLGSSGIDASWYAAFLSGAFSAELHFLFWDHAWQIAAYEGVQRWEGPLFSYGSKWSQEVAP